MILKRTLSSLFLNRVVNEPLVRPFVFCDKQEDKNPELDLSILIGNPLNVTLVSEYGGFIFHKYEPGIYEVHTQFLPTSPPGHALEAAKEARKYIFSKTDAVEVYTRVSESNPRAKKFTESVGWTHRFKCGVVDYYVMRYDDWIRLDNDLVAIGEQFHSAVVSAGIESNHGEDQIHDKYVGATIETIFGGFPKKAVALYNRWATSCAYRNISIHLDSPLIVDIVTCLIYVRESDYEVIKCQ